MPFVVFREIGTDRLTFKAVIFIDSIGYGMRFNMEKLVHAPILWYAFLGERNNYRNIDFAHSV